MPSHWMFAAAGEFHFGNNAIDVLPEVSGRLGSGRTLVVTDKVLRDVGVVERVTSRLPGEVHVYDGGEPEPTLAAIDECVAAGRDFNPSLIVGLGGGSNMDAAKLVAAALGLGGSARDYAGDCRVPGPMRPLVCVPTTAGTGSEVSMAAVFTDTERGLKVGVLSNRLRPAAAVVDPLLTASCPPHVTADSGIDALTHAVEAYTATGFAEFDPGTGRPTVYQGKHPLGDLMAGEAIRLVGRFLKRAVADGSDSEAREGMALAASLAGMAFSNVGVAAVHALEYALGGTVHMSHGRGNGLLLPYVMRFNLGARGREFADIAAWLGAERSPEAAVAAVEGLRAAIGIPHRLREVGVTEEMLPAAADKAFAIRRMMNLNARTPTRDELLELLREAL